MDRIHPLRAFRQQQHPPLTQEQLAGMLGKSRVTVARWELGTRQPGAGDLKIIHQKLGIAPGLLRRDFAEVFDLPSAPERRGPARPRRAVRAKSRAA